MPRKKIEGRPTRNKFGGFARNLHLNERDPNYVYRVFNDQDDRIQLAEANGYEVVHSEQELGDPKAGNATKLGSAVTKPVGGGMTGVLMRIPKDEYEAAKKIKAAYVDRSEEALDKSKAEGHYGKLDKSSELRR